MEVTDDQTQKSGLFALFCPKKRKVTSRSES